MVGFTGSYPLGWLPQPGFEPEVKGLMSSEHFGSPMLSTAKILAPQVGFEQSPNWFETISQAEKHNSVSL